MKIIVKTAAIAALSADIAFSSGQADFNNDNELDNRNRRAHEYIDSDSYVEHNSKVASLNKTLNSWKEKFQKVQNSGDADHRILKEALHLLMESPSKEVKSQYGRWLESTSTTKRREEIISKEHSIKLIATQIITNLIEINSERFDIVFDAFVFSEKNGMHMNYFLEKALCIKFSNLIQNKAKKILPKEVFSEEMAELEKYGNENRFHVMSNLLESIVKKVAGQKPEDEEKTKRDTLFTEEAQERKQLEKQKEEFKRDNLPINSNLMFRIFNVIKSELRLNNIIKSDSEFMSPESLKLGMDSFKLRVSEDNYKKFISRIEQYIKQIPEYNSASWSTDETFSRFKESIKILRKYIDDVNISEHSNTQFS